MGEKIEPRNCERCWCSYKCLYH